MPRSAACFWIGLIAAFSRMVATAGESITGPVMWISCEVDRLCTRAAMAELNVRRGTEDLIVKIGIHEGPCLAVMLNERQDYFGQTVNIAARVQSLSTSQEIHITGPIIDSPAVATILERESIRPIQKEAALRGIADKIVVYEIP